MAKSSGQKLKLLYILKMLMEHTDEHHAITTKEIIECLAANDIRAERKSIYDDINALIDFGYDILQVQSRKGGGYFLASRDFELAELKLLVDAVQSSRFITTKKSRELIKKIEHLLSKHDAGKLQRQVYVAGRIKTENESIYYSIDAIHNAIQENCQIKFTYMDWTLARTMKPRKEGEQYQVSPWALIWKEENYYLAAFESETDMMKHYRVDKMGPVTILSIPREGMQQFEKVNLADYTNQTFGMFGGEEEIVTLRFPNRLIGVILDRFGKDVDIRPDGEEYFRVRVRIVISGQFFGWLTGIGKDAEILSPETTYNQYKTWLSEILNQ